MPKTFQIPQPFPIGFLARTVRNNSAAELVQVPIYFTQLLSISGRAQDTMLEHMGAAFFRRIPGLLHPERCDHIVLLIAHDGTATAYHDELVFRGSVRLKNGVSLKEGDFVRIGDIESVERIECGVDFPADQGVIVFRSLGWKRSVFYDFGPLHQDRGPRDFAVAGVLAQQMHELVGLSVASDAETPASAIDAMDTAMSQLELMLKERVNDECAYQEFLAANPWLFSPQHSEILRHIPLDDTFVPDFLLRRQGRDDFDMLEIKQPFLPLFRRDGRQASALNDAWNQAEAYVAFAIEQSNYLLSSKGLRFHNPRCILLIGDDLVDEHRRKVDRMQASRGKVELLTYTELLARGRALVNLLRQDRSAS